MKKNVIVIGGGVIGICTAYYLQKAGHDVTVLERDKEPDGCSYGNAGMIVPSHFIPLAAPGMMEKGFRWMLNSESPFFVKPRLSRSLAQWGWRFYKSATEEHVKAAAPLLLKLHQASKKLYEELSSDLEFGYQPKGLIMLYKSKEAEQEEREQARFAESLGNSARILNRTELSELDPNISMNTIGGVYYPEDAFLDPNALMTVLTKQIKSAGVRVEYGVNVSRINLKNRKVDSIESIKRKYAADEFVLAAGAFSSELARKLPISLPLQAGKGYSVTVDNPAEISSICSILTEARVAVTPMGDKMRFAGTMEIAGNDLSISKNRVRGFLKSITDYYPKFPYSDLSGLEVWAGLRPCSPDGLPYVGRFKKVTNLISATGHAMLGLSLGAVTGKLVSEIMESSEPSIDMSLLDPDRYN